MAHLLPCSGCARHVRAAEPSCPFCGAAIDESAAAAVAVPRRFAGRAQMFGFRATAGAVAVAAALGTSACAESVVPAYGAPAPDAGAPDAGPQDAGPQDAGADVDSGGGATPLYGGPPAD